MDTKGGENASRSVCNVSTFFLVCGELIHLSVLQVVSVNSTEKFVKMSDGTLQHYDQLLLATGCRLEPSHLYIAQVLEPSTPQLWSSLTELVLLAVPGGT